MGLGLIKLHLHIKFKNCTHKRHCYLLPLGSGWEFGVWSTVLIMQFYRENFSRICFTKYIYDIFIYLQIGRIGLVLTLVYCLLLVPIMLLYRYMELQMTDGIMTTSSNGSGGGGGRLDARKFPPRYEESRYHFLSH